MIQTTQDILFIVLSISIVVLTGMLVYVLLYTGKTMQNMYYISDEVSEKVKEVSEMVDIMRERFMGVFVLFADLVDMIKRVSSRAASKRRSKK